MNGQAPRRRRPGFARRLLLVLLGIQAAWLVLINGALNLPLTQTLLNDIKPEKFQLRWERGWSWYPGQVSLRGGFANGQSRKQQWQVRVDAVDTRVSLTALLLKQVRIQGGSAHNAIYWQRPRLKPDEDYTTTLPHFPEIEGYPVLQVSDDPLPERKPWAVRVNGAEVTGTHEVWIQNVRSRFDATLSGDFSIVSRGGPMAMDIRDIQATFGKTTINGDVPLVSEASLAGDVAFDAFRPREERGLAVLRYLHTDVELGAKASNLAFLNLFLLRFQEVAVRGSGAVQGRLVYAAGDVKKGTKLKIDADDLGLALSDLDASGDGQVLVELSDDTNDALRVAFDFTQLELRHEDDEAPMVSGQGLTLTLAGGLNLLPTDNEYDFQRTVEVALSELDVPDLARFQRYIPLKWPFRLHGGKGTLVGGLKITPDTLAVDLRLQSEAADLGIDPYRFVTNLDSALRLDNPDVMHQKTRADGTYIVLRESRLSDTAGAASNPWSTELRVVGGEIGLLPEAIKADSQGSLDLLRYLGQNETREMLAKSEAQLSIDASVSSLDFVGILLGRNQPVDVSGSGHIETDLRLNGGLPSHGTSIEIETDDLVLELLDYVAEGDGHLSLALQETGDQPGWHLGVALENGNMRRSAETVPGIEDVELELRAVVEDVGLDGSTPQFDLQVTMPSASVPDMRIFNGYLPGARSEGSDPTMPDDADPGAGGARFTGGRARVSADVYLAQNDAQGVIQLSGSDIGADLGEQAVVGDLEARILLAGGTPSTMTFDITGSTLRLDRVRVSGETGNFDDEAWSSELTLTRGETTWVKPPLLDLEAEMSMSDTRPVVALYRNNGGSRFVGRLLDTEDVSGTATLTARDRIFRLPYAFLKSDNIDVGIKGVIDEGLQDGVLYLRWKAVHGLLRYEDGRGHLNLFNTRSKFDAYALPE